MRAGLAQDVDRFRAQQVIWGLTGGVLMLGFGTFSALTRGSSPILVVLLSGVGAIGGVTGADWYLSHRATRRESRMLAEFPTVAELLALAVGAGEGAVGALERVCRLSHGALSDELRRCLADARAGANLPVALQGLADRTGLISLTRFVDGIVIAVERGTPLADVLRAQAQDVREEGRRSIMEAGGRKEIAMMAPGLLVRGPVLRRLPGFSSSTQDVTPPKATTMPTPRSSSGASRGPITRGARPPARAGHVRVGHHPLMTAGLVAVSGPSRGPVQRGSAGHNSVSR